MVYGPLEQFRWDILNTAQLPIRPVAVQGQSPRKADQALHFEAVWGWWPHFHGAGVVLAIGAAQYRLFSEVKASPTFSPCRFIVAEHRTQACEVGDDAVDVGL